MFQSLFHRSSLKLFLVILFYLLFFPVSGYCDGEPSKKPFLRLEGGMHTQAVLNIAIDSGNNFFVSSSKDKTLRIWQLPNGRLRKTIRFPIGPGSEGELNAVAISQNGGLIAAGGNTCNSWEPDKGYCVYLFDSATGNIIRRISYLPSVVRHLSISADGKFLAIVMAGKAGLRVYQIDNNRLLRSDLEYENDAVWVDFDNSGRLVTLSLDGFLRLYNNLFLLIHKKKLAPNSQPYSAEFSPDGTKIAVGFRGRAMVVVFSATDLDILYFPDTAAAVGDFRTITWSKDGKLLYGAGGHKNSHHSLIRKWLNGGKPELSGWGEFVDLKASKSPVSQIVALNDGGIVFSGTSPVLTGIDSQGFMSFRHSSPSASFSSWKRDLLISSSGSTVSFPYNLSDGSIGTFSVDYLELYYSKNFGSKLLPPLTESASFSVTGWDGKYEQLKFNGRSIVLDSNEQVNSLAIARDNRFFVVGTSDNLRIYDKSGRGRWVTSVAAAIQGVNISLDNRVIVAAHEDGVIRWYKTNTGRNFLSLYPHSDRKRWAVWTPNKIFAASPGGDQIIGWHKNRGGNEAALFVPAEKLTASNLRPEVIKSLFRR
ncbi:MAG: hypothetical protein HQL70_10535 [Magnetococcales bacterium]|nr:hypothetical protein [Magnetococcales bacterium]